MWCNILCFKKKLSLYGFQEDVVEWFSSYLSNRRQGVTINGTLSRLLPVNSGVPQGSILGPLLYTLYTNELPEVLKKATSNNGNASEDQICCYADDTTLTCRSKSPTDLSKNLTEQYGAVHDFMTDNGLKLNDDKTHILVISQKQSKKKREYAQSVHIDTPTKKISPTSQVKATRLLDSG